MARQERFVNGGSTTLSGDVMSSDTTIDVASASGFPSEGDFRILINAEVLLVTKVVSTTFTVQRGADNTVASDHSDTDAVEAIITKDAVHQFIRDRDPWANLRPPYAILDSSGDLLTASDFSQINFSTASASDVDGNIVLSKDDHTTASVSALVRSAPSTPYSIVAAIYANIITDFPVNGAQVGTCFRESSSGELYTHVFQPSHARSHRLFHWSSPTGTATVLSEAEPLSDTPIIWYKFEDDGTDLWWYISFDGVHWQFQFTEARGTRFTTAPDQIGFYINNDDGVDGNFVSLIAWDGE